MDERALKHAEAMVKYIENRPFVGNAFDQLEIGRTAFQRYLVGKCEAAVAIFS